jgi:ABC-type enterochelin transport system substrate-binding protein
MKTILSLLAAAGLLLTGCGNNNSSNQTTTTAPSTPAAPASPSSVDYLGTLAAAEKSAVKTVDVASLDKALGEFNVQEGRFPKDLSELVPAYIAHVPVPPVGYKLDYDATAGEVKVVKTQP